MKQYLLKHQVMLSAISIIVVFLAAIRTIIEPLRQQLPVVQIQALLAGALIAIVSCLVMTLMLYYAKYRWIIITAITTIIALSIFKSLYL